MSAESMRRRNLGEVLRLVHVHRGMSRSRITLETGLNRSTVADLVGALSEAGLVYESDPGPTFRVGRPSPVVSARDDVVAIAVHPEVDALEIAAVGFGGAIRVRERRELRQAPTVAEVVTLVTTILDGWRSGPLQGARILGAGLAVPGLVRADDGVVRLAPHLGWRDADIADALRTAVSVPVVVGNDASLGTLAEHLFGAASGHDDVVYLNGGASGIGGGLVIGGRVVGGAGGYAGEWGQNRPGIIAADDRRTADGVLEAEVNRDRLLAVLHLAAADDPTLADALVTATAPAVTEEVSRQRRILAVALANAVNVLNPAVVVLGGFLGMLAETGPGDFLDMVRAHALEAPGERLEIRPAALAEDRLLMGAAETVFATVLADPLGALRSAGETLVG